MANDEELSRHVVLVLFSAEISDSKSLRVTTTAVPAGQPVSALLYTPTPPSLSSKSLWICYFL